MCPHCFLLSLFLKVFYFLQGEWDFSKRPQENRRNDLFLESTIGPIMLCNMLGPIFDSTLDQFLTQDIWQVLAILAFSNMLKPLFYCVLRKTFLNPPLKLGTLFVNTTALTEEISLSSAFVFCVIEVSGNVYIFLGGMTNKKPKKDIKNEQDHAMQTRKPLSLVTTKRKQTTQT